MHTLDLDGIRLAIDDVGSGPPVLLVHGSWTDRRSWDRVAALLVEDHRVVTYDRRGHSESQRLPGPQPIATHVADVVALVEALDLAPVHLVGSSVGAETALKATLARPDLVADLAIHEPPILGLLQGDPELAPMVDELGRRIGHVLDALRRGDPEAAARAFVETVALGPGAWGQLPPEDRRTFTRNAPTFLAEEPHPRPHEVDADAVAHLAVPVLVTDGAQSPPPLRAVVERLATLLPDVRRHTFVASGHRPHRSQPDELAALLRAFVAGARVPEGSGPGRAR